MQPNSSALPRPLGADPLGNHTDRADRAAPSNAAADAAPLAAAQGDAEQRGAPSVDDLLGALLFSVSHDMKSPLLTLSLSSEIIAAEIQEAGDRAQVAADALRRGVENAERLLDSLSAISRARHRQLHDRPVPLAQLLRGHLVVSDGSPAQALVAVDPRPLVETLEALGTGAPANPEPDLQLRLTMTPDEALLLLRLPPALERPLEATPQAALFGSLHTYAGTAIERLAVLEAQLRRQGGAVALDSDRATVRLPLYVP